MRVKACANVELLRRAVESKTCPAVRFADAMADETEERLLGIGVECYAGHRGEQTPRTLSLGDRRIPVVEVLDAWLAPEYRYFKLKGEDGDTYLVRDDERTNTWELTMFRAERIAAGWDAADFAQKAKET